MDACPFQFSIKFLYVRWESSISIYLYVSMHTQQGMHHFLILLFYYPELYEEFLSWEHDSYMHYSRCYINIPMNCITEATWPKLRKFEIWNKKKRSISIYIKTTFLSKTKYVIMVWDKKILKKYSTFITIIKYKCALIFFLLWVSHILQSMVRIFDFKITFFTIKFPDKRM